MEDLKEYYNANINKLLSSAYRDEFEEYHVSTDYKAFWLACMFDDLTVIQNIISNYHLDVENPDSQQNNAFMMACCVNSRLDVIRYLSQITKNIKHKNRYGQNALHTASLKNNNIMVFKYLIEELGFDPSEKTNLHNNCFTIACSHQQSLDVIRYFAQDKKLLHSKNMLGENGLINACAYNNPLILELLIKTYKMKINSCDQHGNIGLLLATKNQRTNNIKYLFDSHYVLLLGGSNYSEQGYVLTEEQKEIMKLIYHTDTLDQKQKDRIVNFFIDKKLTGYVTNNCLIKKLGYNRILRLANNDLLIGQEFQIARSEYIYSPESKRPNFNIQDEDTRLVFSINNIKYYAHKDLLLLRSDAYKNIHSMVTDKENISWDIKNITNRVVSLYLHSYYADIHDHIELFNTEEILLLCELVQRIPNRMLNINSLEYYLVKSFHQKYLEYYKQLVRTNELYYLMERIFLGEFYEQEV
ncbi:MAG: ankyrin repeat protein [Dasosvirus sp.]|uniref:Ankyrin repeat protein n=1 Tax=Dasosvirus sp. TaxID=2487764 RepID=A0A3G4ZR64_9VIRU|nr:MAG: ankyrin repeat protein [Dasosvirus sp.]